MTNNGYSLLLNQAEGLLSVESDYLANAANLSALLFNNLEQVNWLGFYFQHDHELVLGPFQGQPACTRIPMGKGVCGKSFKLQETLLVNDVHKFDGHIVCDTNSESEIVVPFQTDSLSGVLDVDSPVLSRFSCEEQLLFESAVQIFLNSLSA